MKRPRESKVVELPLKRVRDAIASRFKAGDSIALLAWDYGYKRVEIEFCIREAMGRKRKRPLSQKQLSSFYLSTSRDID